MQHRFSSVSLVSQAVPSARPMFNSGNANRYQQPLGGDGSGAIPTANIAGKYRVTLSDGTTGVGVLVTPIESRTGRKLKLQFGDEQKGIYKDKECTPVSANTAVSAHPV
ncbi:uncharacterized protein B0H18DRAFT_1106155 [Fomitopsis serialis]|uniref:uncharacterized protein n=1 Tax=Fomitopsis serialis TaxID=139415 RepID=UPI002007ED3C|nr:uncharacterized protein B0H18DRAFT_1106155 [Neoantrodia serialis]KAH9920658.1 hypothetical protein B0H18DRAFT_1106155 [Neoantrodia serialis]